ncbi:hypothetical protein BASA50_003994 [Batrachochytrium salamandrivorans]|uniref:B30.2/SPRY domain-containing protein n=1 Tax=Batrachochytrium salamandrivorans TaxID=1357716 RepID=A0ABQ8FGY5_9FUNG|nr:hypothetical protein BASA61_004474 [Batrachochytrium salamandrivorans]KAH6598113.1 hypothetical protein BASA50_003994 [Batrachochytrium salamandrivorans]
MCSSISTSSGAIETSTITSQAPLNRLPAELILDVADLLDSHSLRSLASTCSAMRKTLLQPTLMLSFTPRLAHIRPEMRVLHLTLPGLHMASFTPTLPASLLRSIVFDSVSETNNPIARDSASHVYHGLRKRGDRCCFSRLPLPVQQSLPLLSVPLSESLTYTAKDASFSHHTSNNHHHHSRRRRVSLADHDAMFQAVYFEVTILAAPISYSDDTSLASSDQHEASHNRAFELPMRVGLVVASEMTDHEHPPGSICGSVAYRSNDGYVDLGERHGELFQFAKPWGLGDTVGCGYSRNASPEGTVFFTLNGVWVGDAPFKVAHSLIGYRKQWHAAVSAAGRADMSINYGQRPFQFKMHAGQVVQQLQLRSRVEASVADIARVVVSQPSDWKMEANVLDCPRVDYKPATVDLTGCVVQFIESDCHFARSCLSVLPFGYHRNYAELDKTGVYRLYQYYEVTVNESAEGFNSFMAIGLASKPYTPFHQIGWSPYSIGFHSDDAKVFHNTLQYGKKCGEPYGKGDTVGCGYCPETGVVFFTRNGKRLEDTSHMEKRCYFAAVSAIQAWNVSVNFGITSFVYTHADHRGLN